MEIKSGILLTGGQGTRLGRFAKISNKHLHPIHDKLILDYSINTIKKSGIENVTVVLGGEHFAKVVDLLKDGQELGLKINYVYQREARGIAQAINLCEPFIKDERFAVILGDNAFQKPIKYDTKSNGAEIFLNNSTNINLHQFGVVSILNDVIVRFEEKPKILSNDTDNYAVTGAYVFNRKYFEFFKSLKLSPRNEYEIIDIIKQYHTCGDLKYNIQNGWWSDMGTPESIGKVLDLIKTEPVEF
jgi:glucose-1-phosphate thymidylyltransferase